MQLLDQHGNRLYNHAILVHDTKYNSLSNMSLLIQQLKRVYFALKSVVISIAALSVKKCDQSGFIKNVSVHLVL